MGEVTSEQLEIERMSETELSDEHLTLLKICIDMPFSLEKQKTPEWILMNMMGLEIRTRMAAI